MLVTRPVDSSNVVVGVGAVVLVIVTFAEGPRLMVDCGGGGGSVMEGVTVDWCEVTVEEAGGGSVVFELGGGGSTVIVDCGGGVVVDSETVTGGSVWLGVTVTVGVGVVSVGGVAVGVGVVVSVMSGIVTVGSVTSGVFVSVAVAFWSGFPTKLVTPDRMSLRSEETGSSGRFLVVVASSVVGVLAASVVVGPFASSVVEVLDSSVVVVPVIMPIGPIVIPAGLVSVVVGCTEMIASDVEFSGVGKIGLPVGGSEILSVSVGLDSSVLEALPALVGLLFSVVSSVLVLFPLEGPGVGAAAGGTNTVLSTTTVVTFESPPLGGSRPPPRLP